MLYTDRWEMADVRPGSTRHTCGGQGPEGEGRRSRGTIGNEAVEAFDSKRSSLVGRQLNVHLAVFVSIPDSLSHLVFLSNCACPLTVFTSCEPFPDPVASFRSHSLTPSSSALTSNSSRARLSSWPLPRSHQPGHRSPSLPAPHQRCTSPGVPQLTLTHYVLPLSDDVDVPPHPQPSGKARKSSSLAERSKSIQALLYLWTRLEDAQPIRTIGGSARVHGFLGSRPRYCSLVLGGG